ncbi:carboxypeptidase-like regulatory domain family protein [Formosa agariphila KMM 3901]|uniref:Carboxypeptidase-like regulatory domain family protein n=1 Tax=Formosa agariphila (strain DSM 15362 / KCTC 12365 / LMG 23005 / KMM 3901 / M-2Alg 35-1) TaxID=1347342 RepID=T2KRY3_FORAG|nr:carboxypeptidase-like regulatory domain-containing protein [Formosa agariphila]CDF81281.1 carboxypeptidase-like regulatory domain family protein [Formosa agariphila KMM 3901]
MSLKLTFLFLFCSYFCFSQEIKISGKVLDDHKSPISYANVILVDKEDQSKIFGTITNTQGFFLVDNIVVGTYNLEISFVGYTGYNTELLIDKVMYLKPVILNEIAEENLKVIEVTIDDDDVKKPS